MLRSGCSALAACALAALLSACGSSDDEPVAGDINLSVAEDGSAKISLLGNNPGRDNLTATVVTPPTNGTVVFTSGSALGFTYTPRANLNGSDFFTYQVADGDKVSNLGHVSIGISAVNDVPVVQPTLTTDEDVPVTAVLITDVDGDTFTSAIVTAPSHGTLTVDASNPGKFTYVPAADFNGTDSVQLSATYALPDTTTATVTGTVAITVTPVNDPPAGVADTMRTVQGVAARFEPLANDRDIDGDALAVTITSGPSVGTATVNADGSIQYTPPAAFVGNTSLEYQVRDARGLTAHATMDIGVGLTSGVLYLARPDVYSPNELFFSDGARSFKVSGPVEADDSVASFASAKSAPVVLYRTLSNRLYRVDLHEPGVAHEIEGAPAGEYALDDTGTQVIYGEAARAAVGTTQPVTRPVDNSFEIVLAAAEPGAADDIYALNLRDPTQLIPISTQPAKSPALVPNF